MKSVLDRIAAGRIASSAQCSARIAICIAVRGNEIGPRFRRGSNTHRGMPAWVDAIAPCPHCGADGGELLSVRGREYCPSCRQDWVIGDYDWECLADILRYQKDEAAGLIENPLEQPCPTCLVAIGEQPYQRCDAARCPVNPIWLPYLRPKEPARPARPELKGAPATLADSLRRLGEKLAVIVPAEAGETVTVEDMRRARFAEAAAEAAERDRRRRSAGR